jgi:signal transduction histidine kinase
MTADVIEARDALAAAEKEREKLGHDLHDGAIQSLYAVSIRTRRPTGEWAHPRAIAFRSALVQERARRTRTSTRIRARKIGNVVDEVTDKVNDKEKFHAFDTATKQVTNLR